MENAIKVIEKDGLRFSIFSDPDPLNPREEWDNIATMALFHNRYRLGDKVDFSSRDFDSWKEMEKYIKKNNKNAVILPVYMYDHSGITISTSPFGDPWDSGRIGFVYVTKEMIEKYCGTASRYWKKQAKKIIDGEISTYDLYLRGDVYGFKLEKVDGEEVIEELDSCWGFYGDFKTSGIYDELPAELKSEVK